MKEYSVGDYIKDKDGNIFFVIASFSAIEYLGRFKCLLVLDKSLIVTSYNLIKFSNKKYGISSRNIYLYTCSKYNKCVYCMLGGDFTLANKDESKELRDQISYLSDDHKKRLIEDVEELLSVIIKENRKQEIYATFITRRYGGFTKYPPFRKILVLLINEYLNHTKHRELASI